MINALSQSGVTDTASLDPAGRIRQWATTSSSSATQTSHYSGDGDSPSWIAENSAGTNWTRNISGFGGLDATVDENAATTLEITDLHGDVVGSSSADPTATALAATSEQTEFGLTRPGQIQGRYGFLGVYRRATSSKGNVVLMGVRNYLPSTGRFLTTDPVYGGSANDYDYADQDPVDNYDVNGDMYCGGWSNCAIRYMGTTWQYYDWSHRHSTSWWHGLTHRLSEFGLGIWGLHDATLYWGVAGAMIYGCTMLETDSFGLATYVWGHCLVGAGVAGYTGYVTFRESFRHFGSALQ